MSRAALDFDSQASAYDAWFREEGKLTFAIEIKAFQELLPLLPRPWLEVGVGSGRFAQALGIETGIDPSAKLLSMARRRGITGFLARGEDSLFDEETFGTVFLIVTLCFVGSPRAVLREARRILKTRGKIALGLVLRDSPWGHFYLAKKEEGYRFYRHATFYSYDEVINILEHAGFAVETVLSTLFQKPGEVVDVEAPRQGFCADAGFTIVVANKIGRGGAGGR
jgi:SAM-dependent methyltransferase